MADVVEKGQNSDGVGKLLFAVYLENTLFKDKFVHSFFRTGFWRHANILTLKEQKGNFGPG